VNQYPLDYMEIQTHVHLLRARGGSTGEWGAGSRAHVDLRWPPNATSNGCTVQCLCSSLCLAFSDADIEFDFVLMTSAYSHYLRDT